MGEETKPQTKFYEEYSPSFPYGEDWNVATVLQTQARNNGENIYLTVPWADEEYTFGETLDIAETVALSMLSAGALHGDRVLIMLPNCSEYIFSWLGSALAGLAEVPINTAYKGAFLRHQVLTTLPSLAVVESEFVSRFIEIRDDIESIKRFYITGKSESVATACQQLQELGFDATAWGSLSEQTAAGDLPEVNARDLGSIFFTSGTTGLSKGVMMPHAHMYLFADECVSLTRLTDQDVYMSVGPLFHGNSQFLAAYPALIAGCKYVLHERFSASEWINQIRDSGATVTNFVGVMMEFVWQQIEQETDSHNDLRCVFAAPTASSILDNFKDRFGVEAFVEVFGLTETCMPILTPYGAERPPGAAGLLNRDWFDIRLVDSKTDLEVPIGQIGELVVRPKFPWTTCQGYFGMPEKTSEAFRNLWFHTGDGLKRDQDGWYYFVDRLKDAIRRRGENISSFEVEQALLSHPSIGEIAAIGVDADQEAGEDEVMVFVILEDEMTLTAEQLWDYANSQLPYFAVPRYVHFISELPKTPSEKVRKIELREIGVNESTHDRGPQPSRRKNRKGS